MRYGPHAGNQLSGADRARLNEQLAQRRHAAQVLERGGLQVFAKREPERAQLRGGAREVRQPAAVEPVRITELQGTQRRDVSDIRQARIGDSVATDQDQLAQRGQPPGEQLEVGVGEVRNVNAQALQR